MSWNSDVLARRRLKANRDRNLYIHDLMRLAMTTPYFAMCVAILEDAKPECHMGRPRRHSAATVLLMFWLNALMGSQAEAELYLKARFNWESYRRLLHRLFPDDPRLAPGAPVPTRSILRHWKKHLKDMEGEGIFMVLMQSGFECAGESQVGVNHGTLLNPSREAGMFGDGVVIRPMTKYKLGDMVYNELTDQWQQRRYDPDATFYTDGTGKKVYGNEFVHLSATTGAANEVFTFGIRPLRKHGTETEADIALELMRSAKAALPGMAMVHYDKAIRSTAVDEIWNMRMMPMIGVYDKTGLTTEQVPLGTKSINGIKTRLFAYRGGVSIRALDGSFVPLTGTKLSYIANASDSYRVYCDYVVPEGANCDTRLWGGKVKQRLNSPGRADVVYGEHVRAHAPGSPDWKALYGNRSLAESVNSWMKNKLTQGERARSLNQTHQWIDLMFLLILRNIQSLMLYRRRTQLARTTAPPAA